MTSSFAHQARAWMSPGYAELRQSMSPLAVADTLLGVAITGSIEAALAPHSVVRRAGHGHLESCPSVMALGFGLTPESSEAPSLPVPTTLASMLSEALAYRTMGCVCLEELVAPDLSQLWVSLSEHRLLVSWEALSRSCLDQLQPELWPVPSILAATFSSRFALEPERALLRELYVLAREEMIALLRAEPLVCELVPEPVPGPRWLLPTPPRSAAPLLQLASLARRPFHAVGPGYFELDGPLRELFCAQLSPEAHASLLAWPAPASSVEINRALTLASELCSFDRLCPEHLAAAHAAVHLL